ncbi:MULTISPECIES: hypothetical protein [unclassified Pseudomonas]|uniref:hypothetical protein n=1 Tax=unclassified Pseudomonas TaxID=196821 RepID=UPI001CBD1047|nr:MULTISPECIES: hypothetical protein [unclassified Pseudomonas]
MTSAPGTGIGYKKCAAFLKSQPIIELPVSFSNLICTIQLVFWAIIEQNGHCRIDDFLLTAHHRSHIDAGPADLDGQTQTNHKNFKNGYTL